MEALRRRLLVIALALSAILAGGTLGFHLLEDYPLFDAFYMALITITTVGYMEIHPLSQTGRVFNTFLLLIGVGTMFYAIGAITQSTIELHLGEFFYKRRVKRMIENLKDHYILCGFGRVGQGAAAELRRSQVPFVVIDRNGEKVDRAIRAGMLALQADSTRDETLREAGVTRARGLVAALATDADNVFLILSAKSLNPLLRVSARVSEEGSEQKLMRAGADSVFMPYNVTGYRLAQAILRPHVFEFLDITTSTSSMGLDVGIEQVQVAEDSALASHSLKDLQLRRDLGVIVLAIRRRDGQMLFNPPADALVHGGDYLIVMGDLKDVRKLESKMGAAKA